MKACKRLKSAIAVMAACLCICNAYRADAAAGFVVKGTVLSDYQGTASVVAVPEKIRTIGRKAFAGNQKIKKVTIREGAETIKSAAFKNCTRLKRVKVPSTVKKIAGTAFDGCKNLTVIAPKGAYALKFAKKHGISWKIKKTDQKEPLQEEETVSFYKITGIECYWYTSGTYPFVAEKKTVVDTTVFDSVYESLLLFNSGEPAGEGDMLAGGKTLRVVISFSDKESRTIECNAGVYMENGVSNKLAEGVSVKDFWDSIEADITEEAF